MKKIQLRLKEKTTQVGDCLMWTGGCHSQGYPMIRDDNNGRMMLVARYYAEQKLGRVLDRDTRVKNTCGNKLCVNIEHYDIVDYHTDIDKWKCTPHQIKQSIRKQIQDDFYNVERNHGIKRDLKNKYGITYETLTKILNERKA